MMRRAMIGMTVLLVGAGLVAPTLVGASGTADTDRDGIFKGSRATGTRTQIEPLIWTDAPGDGYAAHMLNPHGEENGDLWPVVVDSNRAPYYPWVVWSRFTGDNYDLAWSHWNGTSWTPIRRVEERDTPADDLDPDLAFDKRGRPFITWWNEGKAGRGRVFISVYIHGKWLTPSQVSITKIDSRYPTIKVYESGKIEIEYLTPRGVVRQGLLFWERTSITDDIDPHFQLEGDAVLVGQPLVDDDTD